MLLRHWVSVDVVIIVVCCMESDWRRALQGPCMLQECAHTPATQHGQMIMAHQQNVCHVVLNTISYTQRH